jgi:hypothetical protein
VSTKQIEILYLAGCPHIELAKTRANEAITMAGVPAHISLVEVKGRDDALARRFLGSPSVRVDGVDVETSAHERDDFGMQCRVYRAGDRFEGAPPATWISAALSAAGR